MRKEHWREGVLMLSFWGLNGGLFLIFSTSPLPVGLIQVWKSFTRGVWLAWSADFYDIAPVRGFGLWRMVPDTIIIVLGALPLLYFLLTTYPRLRKQS